MEDGAIANDGEKRGRRAPCAEFLFKLWAEKRLCGRDLFLSEQAKLLSKKWFL